MVVANRELNDPRDCATRSCEDYVLLEDTGVCEYCGAGIENMNTIERD